MPLSLRRFVSSLVLGGLAGTLSLTVMSCAQAQNTATQLEQSWADSLTDVPVAKPVVGGTFYVPAYSSVSMSQGKVRADFGVTLSVHNTSESDPLVIKRIGYFDTSGRLVESYLPRPIAMKPFATIEVYVPVNDVRAGTGANFIIDWVASTPITEPVAETMMIGSLGAGHYSFISQGRALKVIGQK